MVVVVVRLLMVPATAALALGPQHGEVQRDWQSEEGAGFGRWGKRDVRESWGSEDVREKSVKDGEIPHTTG